MTLFALPDYSSSDDQQNQCIGYGEFANSRLSKRASFSYNRRLSRRLSRKFSLKPRSMALSLDRQQHFLV
uniref:Uncharacterized protein n=1 Tax=Globodera rostochiensis TaxID=31243 RepID=A0A914HGI9_GLORO